jgi:RNA polymerase sigma-70 factor (ECF subfamily)
MRAEIGNIKSISSEVPRELIEGLRRGDQKAQLQVYKICYRQVYCICLKIISDRMIAEDLMHESFLLAFENIRSYSGDISFTSWTISFIKRSFSYENNC